jgi:hypothetical protein
MFSRGRGYLEYTGLSDAKGLKALETVTFSTTRFSFDQWKKIYNSYKALIETYRICREDEEDEEDETKYQVANVTRKTCCSLLGPLP